MRTKKTIITRLTWAAAIGLCCSACGSSRVQIRKAEQDDGPQAQEVVMEALHIGMQEDAELGLTDFDAATLFHEGLRLQEAERCDRAVLYYDRIPVEFSDSRYLSAAIYNAGRCMEILKRDEEALSRYQKITEQLPKSKDWVDAMFRQVAVLSRLERHRQAEKGLENLLAHDLSISDRIDATVLLGEARAAQGKLLIAEQTLRAALRLFRKHERDEYLDPAPAARAEFRLGELADGRFAAAPLRLPERQMRIDLENKAQLLLSAQAIYLRSMRYGDPEWATAAGYRIGQLYLTMHQAMEHSAAPEDLSEEEAAVYRQMLRKRLAVLLRKALKVFEMTLQLAERTGANNEWTQSARQEMERVEKEVLSLLEPLPQDQPAAAQPTSQILPPPALQSPPRHRPLPQAPQIVQPFHTPPHDSPPGRERTTG